MGPQPRHTTCLWPSLFSVTKAELGEVVFTTLRMTRPHLWLPALPTLRSVGFIPRLPFPISFPPKALRLVGHRPADGAFSPGSAWYV